MEQNKNNTLITHTQKEIIEILGRKVENYKTIAEQYYIQNKDLKKDKCKLQESNKTLKKISIIATTTAVILGLILIF